MALICPKFHKRQDKSYVCPQIHYRDKTFPQIHKRNVKQYVTFSTRQIHKYNSQHICDLLYFTEKCA